MTERYTLILKGIKADEPTILHLRQVLCDTLKKAGHAPTETITITSSSFDHAIKPVLAKIPIIPMPAFRGTISTRRLGRGRGHGPEA